VQKLRGSIGIKLAQASAMEIFHTVDIMLYLQMGVDWKTT